MEVLRTPTRAGEVGRDPRQKTLVFRQNQRKTAHWQNDPIQEALRQSQTGAESRPRLYVQIPDSGDAGVLSAVIDAMETFNVAPDIFPLPHNLSQLAKTFESLIRAGYVVVLDEFRYFNRTQFTEFCSFFQAAADRLNAKSTEIKGGLVVLGSIQTEMDALLEDRSAPLYNRITDDLEIGHLDISSVYSILRDHAEATPERLLFLWSLFEGIPKFYRDCWEQRGFERRPNNFAQENVFRQLVSPS